MCKRHLVATLCNLYWHQLHKRRSPCFASFIRPWSFFRCYFFAFLFSFPLLTHIRTLKKFCWLREASYRRRNCLANLESRASLSKQICVNKVRVLPCHISVYKWSTRITNVHIILFQCTRGGGTHYSEWTFKIERLTILWKGKSRLDDPCTKKEVRGWL